MTTTATRVRRHVGRWPYADRTSSARAAAARLRRAPVSERMRVDHARNVWATALVAVGVQGATIEHLVGQAHTLGVADLAFVAGLGQHLASCRECWQGQQGMRPVDHLTWAVRQRRGLWEVFGPIAVDAAASAAEARRGRRG